MSVKESPSEFRNERRRTRGGSCGFSSCFSGSPVYESADESESSFVSRLPRPKRAEEASCLLWSWYPKKKKMVAVIAADVPVESTSEAAQGKGETNNYKLHNKQRAKSNRPEQAVANKEAISHGTTKLPRISVKYDARSQLPDLVRTRTRTRHVGSSKPDQSHVPDEKSDHQRARLDHLIGLSVLVVTLAVMLAWGRACAVGCLCACFYLVPLLKTMTTVAEGDSRDRENSVKLDLESEEYKKRVVLEGLLERNGRRLSGINSLKAPTTSMPVVG